MGTHLQETSKNDKASKLLRNTLGVFMLLNFCFRLRRFTRPLEHSLHGESVLRQESLGLLYGAGIVGASGSDKSHDDPQDRAEQAVEVVQCGGVVDVQSDVRVGREQLGFVDGSEEAGVKDQLRTIGGSAKIEQQGKCCVEVRERGR